MTNMSKLIVFVVVLCTNVFSWAQPAPLPPVNLPLGAAVISDLKGDVSVTAPQQATPTPAQKGQLLGPNTTVESKKGSVLLTLSDGSQVLVKPNTRVILRVPEEAKGNFLEQLVGKIVAKVKKRTGNEPPFKMGTPSAVITVRGTRFLVEVTNKRQTFVQVYEGLVQVEGLGAMGHPVYLQPGYVTQVGMNSIPDNPRRPLDEFEAAGSGSPLSGRRSERDSESRSGTQQQVPGSQEPE